MPAHPSEAWLEVEEIGPVTVVKFIRPAILDDIQIQGLGRQLYGLVEKLNEPKVLLNFAVVNQLSSAMLGKLIKLHAKVQSAGGRLALCSIDPELQVVFKITQLDKMLNIYRSEQEALQSF